MIATVNLPGSSHFDHFHGTKKECENWLEKKREEACLVTEVMPSSIHSNKDFKKWKYNDGTKVCKCD